MYKMRVWPPPLRVTRPPPSMTTCSLASLYTFAASSSVMVTGFGPQSKVMTPPSATASMKAWAVQLSGVPLPITWSGSVTLSSPASLGTEHSPSGLPAGGPSSGLVRGLSMPPEPPLPLPPEPPFPPALVPPLASVVAPESFEPPALEVPPALLASSLLVPPESPDPLAPTPPELASLPPEPVLLEPPEPLMVPPSGVGPSLLVLVLADVVVVESEVSLEAASPEALLEAASASSFGAPALLPPAPLLVRDVLPVPASSGRP